jgi:hypothetical protein
MGQQNKITKEKRDRGQIIRAILGVSVLALVFVGPQTPWG